MFSSRLPDALDTNTLTRTVARLRGAGTPIIDLTETNPTRVELPYPPSLHSSFISPVGDRAALTYSPEPFGLLSAREAVSREFQRQGASVPPDRIVLTASTSEAYGLLFKLLCDADDEVLIPQPSYPLFELLSRLDLVRAVPYALAHHHVWSIDRASVESALTSRTRAILVVSPNNPTGSVLRRDDLEWLSNLCASRDLALIADEVFADYRHGAPVNGAVGQLGSEAMNPIAALPSCLIASFQLSCLCFTLGGLSKSAGLPQMKLGWIGVGGPSALVADAMSRLELISDTYLSVATPVQVAAAALIAGGAAVRAAIQARIGANLSQLRRLVAERPDMTLLEPEAGWSAVIQVPATHSEEQMVLRLLEEHHVLVHPGYFFDFPREAFLVVSLLPAEETFAEGMRRVLRT